MTFADRPKPSMSGANTRYRCGKCRYRSLPADFGADTELAAVQQDYRVAVAGLQVAGDQPVDDELFALNLR